MLEETGNIWDMKCDARVITTNGAVRNDGACVMGRGVALQAKERYPRLPYFFGGMIRSYGNHVHAARMEDDSIFYSFPVKHHWREMADLVLIQRSAEELQRVARDGRILVPRPGCGNGGLAWSEVKPIIEPILDDRFVVITL